MKVKFGKSEAEKQLECARIIAADEQKYPAGSLAQEWAQRMLAQEKQEGEK